MPFFLLLAPLQVPQQVILTFSSSLSSPLHVLIIHFFWQQSLFVLTKSDHLGSNTRVADRILVTTYTYRQPFRPMFSTPLPTTVIRNKQPSPTLNPTSRLRLAPAFAGLQSSSMPGLAIMSPFDPSDRAQGHPYSDQQHQQNQQYGFYVSIEFEISYIFIRLLPARSAALSVLSQFQGTEGSKAPFPG